MRETLRAFMGKWVPAINCAIRQLCINGGSLARNVHFRVYGEYSERDSEVLASGLEVRDDSDLRLFGFRLDADTSAQGSVILQGDYYHGWAGLPLLGDAKVAGGNGLSRWRKCSRTVRKCGCSFILIARSCVNRLPQGRSMQPAQSEMIWRPTIISPTIWKVKLTAWNSVSVTTLLKCDLRVMPGGMDLNNALNETSDPENQIALGSSMDLPGGIELDAHLPWVDTLVNNHGGQAGTVPSYLDLTLRMGIHLTERWELSVVGQNLLDDHHPEFGASSPTRVEVRQSVFGKVAWRF